MKERGGISRGFVPPSDVGCRSLPGGMWRGKKWNEKGPGGESESGRKGMEGVVSWRNSFHCNVFKKILIKTQCLSISPVPSGACTALGSIIGSGAMSPYPFHSMLVSGFLTTGVLDGKKKKRPTASSAHLLFAKRNSIHDLKIVGHLWTCSAEQLAAPT